MPVAFFFSLIAVCCGYAALRGLGLLKGPTAIGLVVPAGLATLTIVATWLSAIPLAPPLRGVAVAILVAAGVRGLVRDRALLADAYSTFVREQRGSAAVLLLALAVPIVSIGSVFWGVEVPLSPHDGAFHAQIAESLRAGQAWSNWYPPGLPATFAAVLQLLPWVDTARGTFELGITLALLAPLVVFGLALAVWRNVAMASASALFISLTYLYPYFPQIWSGWPLALSMLLTFGVWSIAIEYVERPAWRWAALAGGVLGAIVVVHGTELYTLGLILSVVLAASWRRLAWPRLAAHLGLAGGIAVLCALPYLPTLLHWAGGGGAFSVGFDAGRALEDSASSFLANSTFVVFLGGALGLDLPIRLVLIVAGSIWAVRRWSGRAVVGVGGMFLAIGLAFTLLNSLPAVRALYATTFPWGMSYRTLILVAIAQALLSGAGCVVLGRALAPRWQARARVLPILARRLLSRTGRLLLITWAALVIWALMFTLSITRVVVGFGDDDAAAMRWLRANAQPGVAVANDIFADAGIWTPYKAGVAVVMPRFVVEDGHERDRALIMENIAQLDRVAEAACAMKVGYVYSGAQVSDWDERRFPALDELRASPALEEVFSQGKAAIFRVRVSC